MRHQLARTHMRWRRPAATAFAAILGGTMLVSGVPAANAMPGMRQAPTITRGTVVDRTCQTRSGGVKTCEWLYEWPYKLINGKYTLNIEAYASMNGNINKSIVNIYTYAIRALGAPPHEIAVLQGPGGTGYIEGHDGKRLCSGSTSAGFESVFTYKYWAPKPISAWITGTARGAWQYFPSPCHSI